VRRPIRLMSSQRKRRTDARIGTVVIALALAWYGGWIWMEVHNPALAPWLRENRWLLRARPGIAAILVVIVLLAAFGLHHALHRALRRQR